MSGRGERGLAELHMSSAGPGASLCALLDYTFYMARVAFSGRDQSSLDLDRLCVDRGISRRTDCQLKSRCCHGFGFFSHGVGSLFMRCVQSRRCLEVPSRHFSLSLDARLAREHVLAAIKPFLLQGVQSHRSRVATAVKQTQVYDEALLSRSCCPSTLQLWQHEVPGGL